ncbi:MAG: LacI family DNA-binding transcriptional regulator [Acidimicrobiales bacterium]
MNIKVVAERAQVSPGTVSNVLNHPQRVAEATRERVLAAINEVGYVRNGSASQLRRLRNNAIGLLMIDVRNSFLCELARGAQDAAEEAGYSVLLSDADRSSERLARNLDFLVEQRVAGILVTGSSIEGIPQRLESLRDRGIAIVRADETFQDRSHCAAGVDDIHGGELVGTHLLELGRRRIGFLQAGIAFRPFDDRLTGITRAVAGHASARVVEARVPGTDLEEVGDAVDELLAAGVDAIACANDPMALAVLRNLNERGISIPDDVALIGYDDAEFAAVVTPPLSSVRQPARLVGAASARLLIEECSDEPHQHRHVMFQPELVARASTLGSRDGAASAGAS